MKLKEWNISTLEGLALGRVLTVILVIMRVTALYPDFW